MKLELNVVPCVQERPYCGASKKERSCWTACWGCLGDGTRVQRTDRPNAEHNDVDQVKNQPALFLVSEE